MPVTWLDTPGSTLASRSDSVDFVVTAAVVVTPPVEPEPEPEPEPPVTPTGLTPQPVNETPVAAYILGDTSGLVRADRSGSGPTLVDIPESPPTSIADDRRTGEVVLRDGVMGTFSTPAALVIPGALTITMRVRIPTGAGFSTFVQFGGGYSYGAEAHNVLYQLGRNGSGALTYTRQTGSGSASGSVVGPALAADDAWHFIALRRDTDGSVVLNIDTTTQSAVTPSSPPTGGTSGKLYIGGGFSFGSVSGASNHRLKDVMIWNKRLTDAQITTQRTGMGL